MTNLQQLLTELEQKQTELEKKLDKARTLKEALRQKHEQNLADISVNVQKEVTKDSLAAVADQDKLNIDISKLKLEIADISKALDEIFKL